MNEYTRQLHQAQWDFTLAQARLTIWAFEQGYLLSKGDAYRDDRCPYGSKSSRHHQRLAQDFNLFIITGETPEGDFTYKYCENTEDHEAIGEEWERMGGIWGGRFNDGNHYEWPFVYVPKREET